MSLRRKEEDCDELETRSLVSNCSRTSRQSVANSMAVQARAKAEAARAEFAYARRAYARGRATKTASHSKRQSA